MKRILVATDFSTRSDRALRRAALIARRCNAALTIVHVIDDDQPAYLIRRQRSAATELLEQTGRTLSEVDHVRTDVLVTTGDAFAGILRTAGDIEPDLIVIGPHRRQFLDTFIGTTAERTIRRSGYPVLMANAVPSAPYNRSLLALDLDDASRSAAEFARWAGLLERTDVIALHLFDAPALGMMKRAIEPRAAIDHYLDDEERQARTEIHSFLAEAGLPAIRLLLRPHEGSAAALILSCAEEQGAELVVMGTNQRRGFTRLLLGSVAQQVLLEAKQDVLVVPAAKDAETSVPR